MSRSEISLSLLEHHDDGGRYMPMNSTQQSKGQNQILNNRQSLTNGTLLEAVDGWFGDKRDNIESKYGHISKWDTSKVTSMDCLFLDRKTFNENISGWNVTEVISMNQMFSGAESFNQPLDRWNTSKVASMKEMFANAINFNQPLSLWNVSQVTDMDWMFAGAKSFNQPLDRWNTCEVKSMKGMFANAINFNQSLLLWNVSQVTDMSGMFYYATAFNGKLSWNPEKLVYAESMFEGANAFKQEFCTSKLSNLKFASAMTFDTINFPLNADWFPDNKLIDDAVSTHSNFRQDAYKKFNYNYDGIEGDRGDNYEYQAYGKAIYSVLNRIHGSLCLGLYAPWGSGKSSLMRRLKLNFDTTATIGEDGEIEQWFEKDDLTSKSHFIKESYFLFVLYQLFVDMLNAIKKRYKKCGEYFYRCRNRKGGICDVNEYIDVELALLNKEEDEEKQQGNAQTEYVFVEFNAWEFSNSDELWAGLIKNIYEKVELRLERQQNKTYNSRNISDDIPKGYNENFKRRWRVQKALTMLEEQYGGRCFIYGALCLILLLILGIIIGIILCTIGYINVKEMIHDGSNAVTIIIGIVGIALALVPFGLVARSSHHSSSSSQGEVIFNEANSVQDNIGFLSRVGDELNELFSFMGEYKDETGIELKLLIFIDDLDRCLDGKNVKVLEAVQLILAIPAAPVIVVLALDARVVVASIEATINKSLSLSDALVSGYEYMDKIVNVPFCVPTPSHDMVKNELTRSVWNHSSLESSLDALIKLFHHISHLYKDYPGLQLYFPDEDHTVDAIKIITTMAPNVNKYDYKPRKEEMKDDEKLYQHERKYINDLREESLLCIGNVLSPQTQKWVSIYKKAISIPRNKSIVFMYPREALGLLCRCICERVNKVMFTLPIPRNTVTDSSSPVTEWNDFTYSSKTTTDEAQSSDSTITSKTVVQSDWKYQYYWSLKSSNSEPLLPLEMAETLKAIADIAEPNQRRLRRILNVASIVYEVAKCTVPLDMNHNSPIVERPEWLIFSSKLAHWIYLCELYPYRMSFLTQLLTDVDQKIAFNNKCGPYKYDGKCVRGKYKKMNIGEFYQLHVEKYIYVIESSLRLMRLESDPDLFAELLFMNQPPGCGITCDDVLGPIIKNDDHDYNFSLLHYSYNLNPSMMKQIALDLQQLTSEFNLRPGNSSLTNIVNDSGNSDTPIAAVSRDIDRGRIQLMKDTKMENRIQYLHLIK